METRFWRKKYRNAFLAEKYIPYFPSVKPTIFFSDRETLETSWGRDHISVILFEWPDRNKLWKAKRKKSSSFRID